MGIMSHPLRGGYLGAALLGLASLTAGAEELAVTQPPPQEMAESAGVTLPKYPWHVVNLWWDLKEPVQHFTSLEVDVTIDRDVPSDYNLYISPCGKALINGLQFYGGLQTNINGWADKESRERVFPGKGAIFSRWSSDKKTLIGLDHARPEMPGGLVESAGYEGEFASIRRSFPWSRGTYTWSVTKGETEQVEGKPATWFHCRVQEHGPGGLGEAREIGSLRFEGDDFTYWARHAVFVEVYSTAKLPRSGIPKVNLVFGRPRINGEPVAFKRLSAFYPNVGPAAPDCAWAKADGENCRIEVGPIFKRDEAQRRHDVPVTGALPAKS